MHDMADMTTSRCGHKNRSLPPNSASVKKYFELPPMMYSKMLQLVATASGNV
jgi:hypothetical protein